MSYGKMLKALPKRGCSLINMDKNLENALHSSLCKSTASGCAVIRLLVGMGTIRLVDNITRTPLPVAMDPYNSYFLTTNMF